jgi:putative transposase
VRTIAKLLLIGVVLILIATVGSLGYQGFLFRSQDSGQRYTDKTGCHFFGKSPALDRAYDVAWKSVPTLSTPIESLSENDSVVGPFVDAARLFFDPMEERVVTVRYGYKPEEIVAKLRQVDVLVSQGQNMVEAIRQIGVSEVTYYRWRQKFGGLTTEEVKKRHKDLWAESKVLLVYARECETGSDGPYRTITCTRSNKAKKALVTDNWSQFDFDQHLTIHRDSSEPIDIEVDCRDKRILAHSS